MTSDTPPVISTSRRWLIVDLLFVASFINYLDRGTISVAVPLIAHDLHFGPELKGVLLSAFFWSYASMQIPIGWAADRYNLRWLYTGAFLLWSISQGLTGIATSLGMLIVFRIFLGAGESIYLPGGTKIMTVLFAPKDRGFPSGIFDCGTRAGLALGAPVTALLIKHYGWRNMFLIVGFVAVLWLVPWLATFPSRLPKRAWRTDDDSNRVRDSQGRIHQNTMYAPPVASTDTPSVNPALAPGPRRLVSFDRNLLGICLGFFCFDYYWYLLVTWLPDYLMTVRHFPLVKAGIYAAMPYVVFGASEPLGGWIADRLIRRGWNETRTRKGIITVAFLTGLLLIPAARVESASQAIWLISGASLVGFGTANLLVILQCCAPEEEVGIWTGFENFAGNVAGVIAPLATGLLISRTGSYFPGFLLAALLLVTGLIAYWFVVGELKPRTGR